MLWDGGKPIGESGCVSCGHCVTVCPCNALMEKAMLGHAGFLTMLPKNALEGMIDIVKGIEPETGYAAIMQASEVEAAMRDSRVKRTKSVCTYCGVGCSFEIWTKDRHILKVEPAEGPANGISTCVKGKFGWDFVNSADRLTKPLIRENGKFRAASWDEALDLVARRFAEIKTMNGSDALAFISSSKCTNEESYLMQKLARAVIGTNNMDNCSRYCQSPATMGLFRTVGYGGDSGSIRDIENAGLVIIIGSNTAESHPVLATRVKRAHKLCGQKLVVADLRENEMARRADLFIRPNPGTDLVWLSAVTRHLLETGRANTGVPRPVGQRPRRLPKKPRTIHTGIRLAKMRSQCRGAQTDRLNDCRSERCVCALGHGRHPAQNGLRHVHGNLKPPVDHWQLHAAGRRRLSFARPQQRAGSQRSRRHAEFSSRVPEGG